MKNLKFRLIWEDGWFSEFKGFVNECAFGMFEGLFTSEGLLHDIIEHGFEGSYYFKTSELDVAGECVAMGIRQYLYENSYWSNYISYNPYKGIEWNTWKTIYGLLSESSEEYGKYPANFDYVPKFKFDKDRFEDYMKTYVEDIKTDESLIQKAEEAVAYGYELGEKLYGNKIEKVMSFAENIQNLFEAFTKYNITEESINNAQILVSINENSIYADFEINEATFRVSHLACNINNIIRKINGYV